MLKSDLHIHTTASDGVFTPSKVVFRAKEKDINLLAVTDHDTISGIAEANACGEAHGIRILPGVELSCGGSAEIHILGYGIDPENKRLNRFLLEMREERIERAKQILEKLEMVGIHVELPDTPSQSSLGRPAIARAMAAKGYVSSVQDAFERYIGSGCAAYVPRKELDVKEAIILLREIGAVPVLAHPSLIRMGDDALKAAFEEWSDAGLMGIELYHPAMFDSHRSVWKKTAKNSGMLVTGGSDFHAIGDKHADIGAMVRYWKECEEDTEKLLDAAERMKKNE